MVLSMADFIMVDGSLVGCFNNDHFGTSDAVSERRPPHHRNSRNSVTVIPSP